LLQDALLVVDILFLAHLLQLALPVLLAAVASVFELRTGNIPNALTLGAGALGIAVVAALDRDLAAHVGGFVLGAVVFLAIYRADWLGGGSVKLGIAIAAIAGPFTAALFLGVFAAFFGAAYLVMRSLRGKETIVPGSPVLLTAILFAEAAAPFLRPLL
jgi:Flp pilus assembly protein protease CpaA